MTDNDRVDVVHISTENKWAVVYDAPRSKKLREVGRLDDAHDAYVFRQGVVAGLEAAAGRARVAEAPAGLTPFERHALASLVAAIVNDDAGFGTYGLDGREQSAVRRALGKLT